MPSRSISQAAIDTINARRQWGAKQSTIAAVQSEIVDARRQFKTNAHLIRTMEAQAIKLKNTIAAHTRGGEPESTRADQRVTATNVYHDAIVLAVLALRIAEEGDALYRYGRKEEAPADTPDNDPLAQMRRDLFSKPEDGK